MSTGSPVPVDGSGSAPARDLVVLCGGVGAARLLRSMVRVVDPRRITAIVNTADDVILHGLHVSPDLDTVTYTLAGIDNTTLGWGIEGETWQAMEMLRRYGGVDWFNLGDRDLGTHLYRTHRLRGGARLAEVTREIVASWDIAVDVVPVTEDRIETRVTVADEGEIGFQEYFVRRHHDVAVERVRIAGVDEARPTPGVLDSIAEASRIVIAPSNPIVSIGPILAVPGVRRAVAARRAAVVAVSPLIGGRALKGPADRMMTDLGLEASVVGLAAHFRDLAASLVIDTVDADLAAGVEAEGMRCVVTDTIMADPVVADALCHTVLHAA